MSVQNRQLVDGRFRLAVSLLIAAGASLLLLVAGALPVQAGGVVTDCSDAGDFSAKLAGGGVVTFACGPNPPAIVLTGTKTIALNTTIDGGGVITLSGGGSRRLFVVNNGAVLELNNLAITGGYSTIDGGAIFVSPGGALAADNSQFLDNHVTVGGSGGAICSYGPLTITNSTFAYNSAANGGALYPRFSPARTLIVNSVLHDNSTISPNDGWGGALLSWGAAPITIQDSTFYSNTARSGGALYGIASSQFYLTNVTVTNNLATLGSGGGLDVAGSLQIVDSQILSNTAFYTDTTLSYARGGGGGINVRLGAQAFIAGSRIDGNVVTPTNGAYIYPYGGGIFSAGSLSLTASSLSGNFSQSVGGAVAITGSATLSYVTMTNNVAPDAGSALAVLGGTLEASGATLEGNYPANALNNDGTASISTSRFVSNQGFNGGAIWNSGNLTLSQSLVMSNTAQNLGGGIVNHSTLGPEFAALALDQVTIRANSAISNGGGIWTTSPLMISSSTLSDNSTAASGGAIYNRDIMLAVNSTISGNRANQDGGGIFNIPLFDSDQIGVVNVYNLTIAFNVADADGDSIGAGGGIFNDISGTAYLRNSLVAGNTLFTTPNDCGGLMGSYGRNLFGTTAGCTVSTLTGSWGLLNALGLLTPLADHGGPTFTHALLPGSNAIDGGDPDLGCVDWNFVMLTTDQRGVPRPQGFACDVGAYEFEGQLNWLYLPLLVR